MNKITLLTIIFLVALIFVSGCTLSSGTGTKPGDSTGDKELTAENIPMPKAPVIEKETEEPPPKVPF